jgi:peptidoglycan/LPS O-acetylase OafA/YrhL
MCALSFWVIKFTGSVVVAWVVVLAIVYFLSYLIYNFVEDPMNRIGHRALPTVLGLQPIQNAGARPTAATIPAGATSRQPVEASHEKQDLR